MSDKPWRDEENLRELYVEKGMSLVDVGSELGCSKSTIRRWLNKFGIGTRKSRKDPTYPPCFRTDSTGYEEVTSSARGEQNSVYIHRLVAVSEYGVDVVGGVEVHHKNGIPWDNREDNLELMTTAEHTKRHWEQGELHPGLFGE